MTTFLKMHGLGNDFVIFDARIFPLPLDPATAKIVADRKRGIGCDQVIVMEPAKNGAAAFMRIFNGDGGLRPKQFGKAHFFGVKFRLLALAMQGIAELIAKQKAALGRS